MTWLAWSMKSIGQFTQWTSMNQTWSKMKTSEASQNVQSEAKELLGQMIHTIFGPLSIPVLLLLYGGKVGLENRAFWLFSSPVHPGSRVSAGEEWPSYTLYIHYTSLYIINVGSMPYYTLLHHILWVDHPDPVKELLLHWLASQQQSQYQHHFGLR